TATEWRGDRQSGVGNRVLDRNVSVGDVQNVAVVRLQVRHEHVAAAPGLSDLLMARERADTLDARHANQREALLNGSGRVESTADADDAAHGAERGGGLRADRFLAHLVAAMLALETSDARGDVSRAVLDVQLIAVAGSDRQRLLRVDAHAVSANVMGLRDGCRCLSEEDRQAGVDLASATVFVVRTRGAGGQLDVTMEVNRREQSRPLALQPLMHSRLRVLHGQA